MGTLTAHLNDKLFAERAKTATLEAEVRELKANQRPKDSRACGYCGWEQIMVSGEWKCGSCSKQRKIDDLGKKFALEIADMRMRLSEDSRERIDELKAERDNILALLREIEFNGMSRDGESICPCCGADPDYDKHEDDCALGNALKESG